MTRSYQERILPAAPMLGVLLLKRTGRQRKLCGPNPGSSNPHSNASNYLTVLSLPGWVES